MIEILNNHCNDKNGLLLFSPPTGSGKTYNVLEWIYNNYKTHCTDGKKIFFITNLKKNLPDLELKERFKKDNRLEDYDKDVIFLNSNVEFVLQNLEFVLDEIPEEFKDANFRALKSNVSRINYYKENGSFLDMVSVMEDELRKKYEPLFRDKLTQYLKTNFPNRKERLYAIKTYKHLKWIGKLYPSVFTSKAKIYFLSIDKFFAKNSTLVEPSYYFSDNGITKDAIIFIDEFDATKERLLNKIIEQGKNQKIDYIDLFNKINWALSNNELPAQYLIDSASRVKEISKGSFTESVSGFEKKLIKRAKAIVDEFCTQYSFKTKTSVKNGRNLLFQDFHYHSIYNDGDFIKLAINKTEKLNQIEFSKTRPDSGEPNVVMLLNQIKGFVKTFQHTIKIIAANYVETINEKRKEGDTEYTFDLALSSVLEEFRLEYKHKQFISDAILINRQKRRNKTANGTVELNVDLSMYENGFRYYDFVDDEQHESITKAYIYNFQNTPEKFILKLAEKSKIIGISATATIETVTGNYDIDYFKRQLGDNFHELSRQESKSLKELFENQNYHYNKININTDWVGSSDLKKDFLELFNGDAETTNEITSKLPDNIDAPNKNQYKNIRIYRIAKVFKEFLLKDDIQAFLCLLTKEPKKGDYSLDLDLLNEIFEILIEDITKTDALFEKNNGDKLSYQDSAYTIINSSDFEKNKSNFLKKFEAGKKLFVISMYQTLGAGQNLQFVAPNPKDLISVLNTEKCVDWNKNKETDFNAIYLDKPTHLIQLINKSLDEEGFIKYLFQLEFLLESGRISIYQLDQEVERAFENLLASKNKKPKIARKTDLYNDKNIRQHFSKFIIQALGRICRTNLKAKNIYVFANDEIQEFVADFDIENNLVLNEFKALVKSAKRTPKKNNEEQALINKAKSTNKKINVAIKKYVKRQGNWNWTSFEMNEWKQLRLMCLSFPTLSIANAKKHARFVDLFIEMPNQANSISYSHEEDYNNIDLSFGDNLPQSVSQHSARLAELMEIPGVKSHFESNKWATEFEEGKFIIPPQLFNNIYKGALGEEIGKFIFEKQNIILEELENEHFELFDYKIKDTSIYVDFKHWQDHTTIPENKNKILSKLKAVKGTRVLIVNILSENYIKPITTIDKKIVQIPSLWNPETQSFITDNLLLINSMIDEGN